jgi:phosphoenolpyruvate-protein phosphotransferase (PTS system enzyme I)
MSKKKKQIVLKGSTTSAGIVSGLVHIHKEIAVNFNKSLIDKAEAKTQIFEFRKALAKTRKNLQKNHDRTAELYGLNYADIFKGQIALLEDSFFLKEVEEAIEKELVNAEAATYKIFSSKKDYFLKLDNQYFKDRAFDIQDLKRQIISNIRGEKKNYSLNNPSIIVAKEITPSDTIGFKRELILGFVTEFGGNTSHSAIFARSLNIPSISGISNIVNLVDEHSKIILDAVHGQVILNPSSQSIIEHEEEKLKYEKYIEQMRIYGPSEAVLADKTPIKLSANIEFMDELDQLEEYNIKSIGLYRTEGYYLANYSLPDEETQVREIRKIINLVPNGDIIIRTLDIGGDKVHEKYESYFEENPFLGWRAIRLCLDEIGLFRTQLRAILRSSSKHTIKIMLPMITDVSEIWEAKSIIEQLKLELAEKNITISKDIKLGIMVETPAIALLMDQVSKEIDFISIGTNDLVQYLLAVDRGNEKVSYLYQSLHPAVLKTVDFIIKKAKDNNIEYSMCGEMASDPLAFPLLVSMGLRHFSMTASKSLVLKRMMKDLTLDDCHDLYNEVKQFSSYIEVNRFLNNWWQNMFPDLVI